MKKYLHFICPTDGLELCIKNELDGEHYFLSSLGNSMRFDEDVIEEIEELVITHDIDEICFVLSDNNQPTLEVISGPNFSTMTGLGHFRVRDMGRKEKSLLQQAGHQQFLIASYHLREKVIAFENAFSKELLALLPVSGKVYNRHEGSFCDICPLWIPRQYQAMN